MSKLDYGDELEVAHAAAFKKLTDAVSDYHHQGWLLERRNEPRNGDDPWDNPQNPRDSLPGDGPVGTPSTGGGWASGGWPREGSGVRASLGLMPIGPVWAFDISFTLENPTKLDANGKKLKKSYVYTGPVSGPLAPVSFSTSNGSCSFSQEPTQTMDVGVAQLGFAIGFGGLIITFWHQGKNIGSATFYGLIGIGGGGGNVSLVTVPT